MCWSWRPTWQHAARWDVIGPYLYFCKELILTDTRRKVLSIGTPDKELKNTWYRIEPKVLVWPASSGRREDSK